MRRGTLLCAVAGAVLFVVSPTPLPAAEPTDMSTISRGLADDVPAIQLALLLDTSNSMDGLIDQARTQLWKIVNELGRCRRDGRQPRFEIALYEYGNDGLSPDGGFIRQVLPLTTDLDLISEKLFSLRTNGGSEYCGNVIRDAVRDLEWARSPRVYKAIFIAGNEPFTQGRVDYRSAVDEAIGRGVVVNTIHCGAPEIGRSGSWDDGARRGEGKFLNINPVRVCVVPSTPMDVEINRLSIELNTTYIPYGDRGKVSAERQSAQDALADANADRGAQASRAAAKASVLYDNRGWDLVDAVKNNAVEIDTVPSETLPESLQAMDKDQIRKEVEAQSARRTQIQEQIQDITRQRDEFLAKAVQDQPTDTLDTALLTAVREQATAKGFESGK